MTDPLDDALRDLDDNDGCGMDIIPAIAALALAALLAIAAVLWIGRR